MKFLILLFLPSLIFANDCVRLLDANSALPPLERLSQTYRALFQGPGAGLISPQELSRIQASHEFFYLEATGNSTRLPLQQGLNTLKRFSEEQKLDSAQVATALTQVLSDVIAIRTADELDRRKSRQARQALLDVQITIPLKVASSPKLISSPKIAVAATPTGWIRHDVNGNKPLGEAVHSVLDSRLNDIYYSPSNRLAARLSADNQLSIWNLIDGVPLFKSSAQGKNDDGSSFYMNEDVVVHKTWTERYPTILYAYATNRWQLLDSMIAGLSSVPQVVPLDNGKGAFLVAKAKSKNFPNPNGTDRPFYWDFHSSELTDLNIENDHLADFEFSADGQLLLVHRLSNIDGHLLQSYVLSLHAGGVGKVVFGPVNPDDFPRFLGSNHALIFKDSPYIKLVHLDSNKMVEFNGLKPHALQSFALSPNQKIFAVCYGDGLLEFYNAQTGELLFSGRKLQPQERSPQFSSDNRTLLLETDYGHKIVVFQLEEILDEELLK